MRPGWLRDFEDSALPEGLAQSLAHPPRSQSPDGGPMVAVLGYGLVRSRAQLSMTVKALGEQLLATGALDVYVHAYCFKPDCTAPEVRTALHALGGALRELAISVEHNSPKSTPGQRSCARRRYGAPSNKLPHGQMLQTFLQNNANYHSATASLRAAHHMAVSHGGAEGARPYNAFVLWRVDTLLLPPRLWDFWLGAPWSHPSTLFVPARQSGGSIADRFIYGHADLVADYLATREALVREHCTYGEQVTEAFVKGSQVPLYSGTGRNCAGGLLPMDRFAVLNGSMAVRTASVDVAFSRVKLIRLRADLQTTNVDNASTLGEMRPRSWFKSIHTFDADLSCKPWVLTFDAGNGTSARLVNRRCECLKAGPCARLPARTSWWG